MVSAYLFKVLDRDEEKEKKRVIERREKYTVNSCTEFFLLPVTWVVSGYHECWPYIRHLVLIKVHVIKRTLYRDETYRGKRFLFRFSFLFFFVYPSSSSKNVIPWTEMVDRYNLFLPVPFTFLACRYLAAHAKDTRRHFSENDTLEWFRGTGWFISDRLLRIVFFFLKALYKLKVPE